MLRKLLKRLSKLFSKPAPGKPKLGDKVGYVTIQTEAQLIKHTKFEPGQSYRLGEAIVTVHATREDMLAAIAAVNARREAKHAALTEKAINIMLMTPDQLAQFKIEQWLKAGEGKHKILRGSKLWGNVKGLFRRLDYKKADATPSGANPNYKQELAEAFKATTGAEDKPVKVKDKVH